MIGKRIAVPSSDESTSLTMTLVVLNLGQVTKSTPELHPAFKALQFQFRSKIAVCKWQRIIHTKAVSHKRKILKRSAAFVEGRRSPRF
ncbi:hypothetical protein TNCV_4038241 [Trichonephila clavipes]|nr:hypothetical protein TNCV_4038241 [Trichonephila clavipes]